MSDYRSPLLGRHGAVAEEDGGVAWHYGDPVGEQRALESASGFVDLSNHGVVRVGGPDRLTWLNSLTSQQLDELPPRTSTETLVLSPQGHVEFAAAVVDDGDATWLIVAPGRADGLAAWLDSMRFRMRVEVTDETDRYAALGEPVDAEGAADGPVAWRDPWPEVAPGGTRYGPAVAEHPGAGRPWRIVLIERGRLMDAVAEREAAGWRLAGTWAAEALRVEAYRPSVAEIDHRTIPHELDWLRTAVHLHKGCYRGQETIARVHNLGRPPRRIVLLHLDGSSTQLPELGARVRWVPGAGPDGTGDAPARDVGTVTSVARHHTLGPIALAVIKRSVPTDAVLTVDCDGAPAQGVSAAQETIVSPDGVSVDRPAPRGEVARGVALPGGGLAGSGAVGLTPGGGAGATGRGRSGGSAPGGLGGAGPSSGGTGRAGSLS